MDKRPSSPHICLGLGGGAGAFLEGLKGCSLGHGEAGMPLVMRYEEAEREVGGALNLDSGNLDSGPNSAIHSTFDLGQVNFSSLASVSPCLN